MRKTYLPSIVSENGLERYMQEISKFPMLSKEEEYMFAKQKDDGDIDAAQALITSHLRLVVKIAMGYRGYGLPIGEVISEGNIGLMKAVKKFEAEKGFRLATYAMWWIKASIQEYVLRSWSLVKIGTSAAQKRMFFNLRKIKNKLDIFDDTEIKSEQLDIIASQLSVSREEVLKMNSRLSGGDNSLNETVYDEGAGEWQDFLTDEGKPNPETITVEKHELSYRSKLLHDAMDKNLTEREKDIVSLRKLSDTPVTLEGLSNKYHISRERIRQIESTAMEKLKKAMIKPVA